MKVTGWKDRLDARQRAEVELARVYVQHYNHGTAGHNRLQLIALLADLLDEAQKSGWNFSNPDTETVS